MQVYIIANIKDTKNRTKGYRLLDIDNTVSVKDVTKEQLIYVIKHKNFKVENAKFSSKKSDKKLLAVGVIISLLGIIALIITLIANRIVDREFISDK